MPVHVLTNMPTMCTLYTNRTLSLSDNCLAVPTCPTASRLTCQPVQLDLEKLIARRELSHCMHYEI